MFEFVMGLLSSMSVFCSVSRMDSDGVVRVQVSDSDYFGCEGYDDDLLCDVQDQLSESCESEDHDFGFDEYVFDGFSVVFRYDSSDE